MTLYCWTLFEDQVSGGDFDLPYPLGTVVSNPNHERALSITLTFPRYNNSSSTVVFPSKETILASVQYNGEEEVVIIVIFLCCFSSLQ